MVSIPLTVEEVEAHMRSSWWFLVAAALAVLPGCSEHQELMLMRGVAEANEAEFLHVQELERRSLKKYGRPDHSGPRGRVTEKGPSP